jgi:hypothetical protein
MNDARLRLAKANLNNRVRRYKMRQMMMPDFTEGGKMIETQEGVVQRVEGSDELIPEDYPFEKRSDEWTSLPEENKRLKGQVIIQEEELALREASEEREGLVL